MLLLGQEHVHLTVSDELHAYINFEPHSICLLNINAHCHVEHDILLICIHLEHKSGVRYVQDGVITRCAAGLVAPCTMLAHTCR